VWQLISGNEQIKGPSLPAGGLVLARSPGDVVWPVAGGLAAVCRAHGPPYGSNTVVLARTARSRGSRPTVRPVPCGSWGRYP
jgi:hypothetical protein